MHQHTAVPNQKKLRRAIQEQYTAVANDPGQAFDYPTGRALLALLGYDESWLIGLSELAIESAAGTGNPFSLDPLRPGQRVVDVGCGAGLDSLIAGRMVGPDGWVIGVDMTPAMVDKARATLAECSLDNVTFQHGYAEALPVPDAWADVVIANGLLNLIADPTAALQEMARVLKPGGRLKIVDIVVDREALRRDRQQIGPWTGATAGLEPEVTPQMILTRAGFVDFAITWRKSALADASRPHSSPIFGPLSFDFSARKARSEQELCQALGTLHGESFINCGISGWTGNQDLSGLVGPIAG